MVGHDGGRGDTELRQCRTIPLWNGDAGVIAATRAQTVITVTPNNATIPDTTPLGASIATFTVTMSDGSPFAGTVGFAAPYNNAGGIFAISGNNIIIGPSGPGVGPNTITLTDQITLEASE